MNICSYKCYQFMGGFLLENPPMSRAKNPQTAYLVNVGFEILVVVVDGVVHELGQQVSQLQALLSCVFLKLFKVSKNKKIILFKSKLITYTIVGQSASSPQAVQVF